VSQGPEEGAKPALPPEAGGVWRRVIGVILAVAGILLLVGSGLCTAVFAVSSLSSGPEGGLLVVALIIGVPAMAVGGLIWWLGSLLLRRRR